MTPRELLNLWRFGTRADPGHLSFDASGWRDCLRMMELPEKWAEWIEPSVRIQRVLVAEARWRLWRAVIIGVLAGLMLARC